MITSFDFGSMTIYPVDDDTPIYDPESGQYIGTVTEDIAVACGTSVFVTRFNYEALKQQGPLRLH